MERLNKYIDSLKEEVKQCLVDCGGCCILISNDGKCECENANKICFFEQLKSYKDAEEQGLLLRLPCKVGDTVFVIPSRVNCALNRLNGYSENNRVYVQRVHSIRMYSNDRYLLVTCEGLESVLSDTYKETWFLTKEEAKAALEKMKGE